MAEVVEAQPEVRRPAAEPILGHGLRFAMALAGALALMAGFLIGLHAAL